jgi:hypothetical protein
MVDRAELFKAFKLMLNPYQHLHSDNKTNLHHLHLPITVISMEAIPTEAILTVTKATHPNPHPHLNSTHPKTPTVTNPTEATHTVTKDIHHLNLLKVNMAT